jgi:hypothetical protein
VLIQQNGDGMSGTSTSPGEMRPPALPPGTEARSDKRCAGCWKLIDAGDSFCKFCGRRQVRKDAWFYHPVWILVLALFVLGPFALPLVWLSPKSSPAVKIALTLIIVVYSALTFYYSYVLFVTLYRHFSEISDLQGLM